MTARHFMHGLVLETDIALDHARPTTRDADVKAVELPARPVPQGTPDGVLLVEDDLDGAGVFASYVRRPDGSHLMRFQETAEIELDPSGTVLTCRRDPRAPEGILGVLVSGAAVAFVLSLRGFTVLHASAVEIQGGALAFIGSRGMGKSTCASLACALGGRIVTDDVLRVDQVEGAATARLGGTHARLRKNSVEIAAAFRLAPAGTVTADGRTTLQPTASDTDHLVLAGLVVPRPDRTITSTRVRRLPAAAAMMTLVSFPRLVGWRDPLALGRQFDQLADLAGQLPVLVAELPWGPPFDPRVLLPVLAELGMWPAL